MPHVNIDAFEQRSPGRRLAMLHRLSMAYLAGPLAKIGISRGRVGFLMGVLHREGICQEDLSRRMCIDRAATARALHDLELEGFVRREEDPEDRRRKLVYPTDAARALFDPLVEILDAHNAAMFTGLTEEEQACFLNLMDRLVANMRRAVEEVQP